jgi:transposase-like protein
MERRRFTREFKVEAVKLVRERGVACQLATCRTRGDSFSRRHNR